MKVKYLSKKTIEQYNKLYDALTPYLNRFSAADCADEKSIEFYFPCGDREYPLEEAAEEDDDFYAVETHLLLSFYIGSDKIYADIIVVRIEGDVEGEDDGVVDIVSLPEEEPQNYPNAFAQVMRYLGMWEGVYHFSFSPYHNNIPMKLNGNW